MRAVRRTLGWIVALAMIAGLGLILWSTLRGRPQDLPWTPLDLGQPIGLMTGRKLNALTQSYPACRAAIIEQRTQALKDMLATIAPQ